MAGNSQASSPEPTGPGSNFDRIRAEIDSLDTEVRKDTSERLAVHAVITKLMDYTAQLYRTVRRWRVQPTSADFENIRSTEEILIAIYEIFEDDLPRFSSLWEAYQQIRQDVDSLYGRAMDAISVFLEVLKVYEQRGHPALTPGQVATGAKEIAKSRREMIEVISDFSEMIREVVDSLDAMR